MKCPVCGAEMVMDGHNKVDRFMCYDCGYIEGRTIPTAAAVQVPAHHGHIRHHSESAANIFGLKFGKHNHTIA